MTTLTVRTCVVCGLPTVVDAVDTGSTVCFTCQTSPGRRGSGPTWNYVSDVAVRIWNEVNDGADFGTMDEGLYLMYAVLCLVKGVETTAKDVHDAWSAWRTQTMPGHRSLVPFEDLSPAVQALDKPYVEAIHAVAKGLAS